MPAVSVKTIPGGLPEIPLPPGTADRNFRKPIADILEVAAKNSSPDVQRLRVEDIRWSLAYEQGPDPDVDDRVAFAAMLAEASKMYLFARGTGNASKWKGAALLESAPPQIMARFEERARLICVPDRQHDNGETGSRTHPVLEALDEWVVAHPNCNRQLAESCGFSLRMLLGIE